MIDWINTIFAIIFGTVSCVMQVLTYLEVKDQKNKTASHKPGKPNRKR